MELKLEKIGNSRGIRLPKKMIEQCGFKERVEVQVNGKTLTLSPTKKPREGWAEAAKTMHQLGEDKPLIPDELDVEILEKWDNETRG